MMPISKDESIVTQVAAKIAADLTDKTMSTSEILVQYANLFDSVQDLLFRKHGFMQEPPSSGDAGYVPDAAGMIQNAFAGTVAVDEYSQPFGQADQNRQSAGRQMATAGAPSGGLRIAGQQHGDIPAWLYDAAAKAGVTEVWDNRDGLAENAARPWFKDAKVKGKDAVAFWPPKAR